jgi:hypothetical protein
VDALPPLDTSVAKLFSYFLFDFLYLVKVIGKLHEPKKGIGTRLFLAVHLSHHESLIPSFIAQDDNILVYGNT